MGSQADRKKEKLVQVYNSKKEKLAQVYARAFEYEQKYGSCPQCVLAAIQDVLGGIDDEVFKAGYALAGGVGLSTNGTCGALSGGVMALCCKYGRPRESFAKGRYLKCHWLAKKLYDRFVQEYGSCICHDVQKKILGRSFDMWDEHDYDEFGKAGGHTDKCPSVAGNAAMWAAEILLERKEAPT
jgi:C_GCAxxG_C_C family probable redox protein